jgi:hypothetical protein
MFSDLQGIFVPSLDPSQIVGNLAVAFLCGISVSYFYRWTHRGATYSASFVRSLVTLAMITAIVMMVIGNNLARAFGLVGAMSIIRFRTALKDTQDIVYVFFALSVGLAAGVGYRMLAAASTVFVGLTLFSLAKGNFGSIDRREFVLQFTYRPGDGEETASYLPVLKDFCKRHRMVNMKSRMGGDLLDLVFYIDLRRGKENVAFTRSLSRVPGVDGVNLYYDEEPDV